MKNRAWSPSLLLPSVIFFTSVKSKMAEKKKKKKKKKRRRKNSYKRLKKTFRKQTLPKMDVLIPKHQKSRTELSVLSKIVAKSLHPSCTLARNSEIFFFNISAGIENTNSQQTFACVSLRYRTLQTPQNLCRPLKSFACVSLRYRKCCGGWMAILVVVCGKICGKMCGKKLKNNNNNNNNNKNQIKF